MARDRRRPEAASGVHGCTPAAALTGKCPRSCSRCSPRAAARYALGTRRRRRSSPDSRRSSRTSAATWARRAPARSAGRSSCPRPGSSYGVDADGDGRADPMNAADAIFSAANYLRASGAPRDWHRALFAYNHAEWYVDRVLDRARELADGASDDTRPPAASPGSHAAPAGKSTRSPAAARSSRSPGFPASTSTSACSPTSPTSSHATTCSSPTATRPAPVHTANGEHPLGLAVDLVPGPGGSWDDIDRLAAWAEPRQNQPRAAVSVGRLQRRRQPRPRPPPPPLLATRARATSRPPPGSTSSRREGPHDGRSRPRPTQHRTRQSALDRRCGRDALNVRGPSRQPSCIHDGALPYVRSRGSAGRQDGP